MSEPVIDADPARLAKRFTARTLVALGGGGTEEGRP
jgi:hypothetical protein